VSKRALYSQLAEYYDHIYWWKDYGREVNFLVEIFEKYGVRVERILEVACGTGNHTKLLTARGYQVTGIDISEDVLRIARKKVRHGATFIRGDMRNLDAVVDGEYDAVICLFSAISYNVTISDLTKTIRGFYNHVREGGIVVFDTHFTKKSFMDGYRDESVFDDGKVIGARISVSKQEGNVGQISFTYLIKDGHKVIVLRNDVHRLGLFDPQDILRIMQETGFVKNKLYLDWAFKKSKKSRTQFADDVYIGRRLLDRGKKMS
jgi:ubiquinone/menaquinone biosynthesis C-methylase UbiE